MQFFKNRVSLAISANLVVLVLLAFVGSSHEKVNPISNHQQNQHNIPKLNHELSFEITIHGLLLWASMGFLMPIGILNIRMSNREECGRRIKILFYSHVIFQVLAVLLVTAGAVLSIKNFENLFNNNHQRLGLALYAAIWVQALIGFVRPRRGTKRRSMWYSVHWALGTTVSLLGIINIYTGLQAYKKKTSRSIKLWNVLFTAEICFIAFLYLFQDKWEYMKKQGVILGNEPSRPTTQVITPRPKLNKFLSEPS